MVFPVVMYGCESWTLSTKAPNLRGEHQSIGAFELWCWRRLLRAPWTVRKSKLSILKEISPEYSLEGLMLKLKLQYFGYLMWRTDSLQKKKKNPDAGKEWKQGEKGMMEEEMVGWYHQLDVHEFAQTPGVGDGLGSLACCSPWGHKCSNMTEQLNWTDVPSLSTSSLQCDLPSPKQSLSIIPLHSYQKMGLELS